MRVAGPPTRVDAMKPAYWDEAVRALARGDPVLRRLVRRHPGIHLKRRSDPFTTLARAIVGQQISVAAAAAIWKRFVAATGGAPGPRFPRLAPRRPRSRLTHCEMRPVAVQG
jgi:DNA-3-methyladenine glycosylase II